MTMALMTEAGLSPRERQVLSYSSRGFSNKYIAQRLHISVRTVEVHIRHGYQKLEVHDRDELIEQYAGRF